MVRRNLVQIILVMLDDACLSPCLLFERREPEGRQLSADALKQVLAWASQPGETVPEVIFMAGGDKPLDPAIRDMLAEMPGELTMCRLMSAAQQRELGVPFSNGQTVFCAGLGAFALQADALRRRPLILHVSHEDFGRLGKASFLWDQQGEVSLYPSDTHTFDAQDFKAYCWALVDAGLEMLRRSAGGNMSMSLSGVLSYVEGNRCPAGTASFTVGPDGLIYACPAFYHSGERFASGPALRIGEVIRESIPINDVWNVSDDYRWGRCLFRDSILGFTENVNDAMGIVHRAHYRASLEIMKRVSRSGYLFDGLRMLCARQMKVSAMADVEGLQASHHVQDITTREFGAALSEIAEYARLVDDPRMQERTREDGGPSPDWIVPSAVDSGSRKAAFYKLVTHALSGVKSLAELKKEARKSAPGKEDRESPLTEPTEETGSSWQVGEGEAEEGRGLYESAQGWGFAAGIIDRERSSGFAVGKEEEIIRRKGEEAERRFEAWLRRMVLQYGGTPGGGSIWRYDIESATIGGVPVKHVPGHTTAGRRFSDRPAAGDRYIMDLGDADKDIVMRLCERRDDLCDILMSRLLSAADTEAEAEAIAPVARQLGAAVCDIRRWFNHMAAEYGWPRMTGGWKVTDEFDAVVGVGEVISTPQ